MAVEVNSVGGGSLRQENKYVHITEDEGSYIPSGGTVIIYYCDFDESGNIVTKNTGYISPSNPLVPFDALEGFPVVVVCRGCSIGGYGTTYIDCTNIAWAKTAPPNNPVHVEAFLYTSRGYDGYGTFKFTNFS